jgi:hypothetical protein
MKKTIISLFAGVALFAGLSATADAKVHVRVYLGVPYYDYQVGPDYTYGQYGWYRPGHRMHDFGIRLSCNEAGRQVRRNGFQNVTARKCYGRTYAFLAMRHNHRVLVFVDARTGAVWRG